MRIVEVRGRRVVGYIRHGRQTKRAISNFIFLSICRRFGRFRYYHSTRAIDRLKRALLRTRRYGHNNTSRDTVKLSARIIFIYFTRFWIFSFPISTFPIRRVGSRWRVITTHFHHRRRVNIRDIRRYPDTFDCAPRVSNAPDDHVVLRFAE